MNTQRVDYFLLPDSLEFISNSEQIHQITKVLRLRVNDQIIAIHNKAHYLLKIIEIEKKLIKFELIRELDYIQDKELPYYLCICIPLLKNKAKLDLIMQKATELGMNEICILNMSNATQTNINWEHQCSRWQRIIEEAVEQSERYEIPVISQEGDIQSFLSEHDRDINISFVERLADSLPVKELKGRVNLFFGPEGGYSLEEKEFLQNATQTLTLGSRILRTETAVIAGLSRVIYSPS